MLEGFLMLRTKIKMTEYIRDYNITVFSFHGLRKKKKILSLKGWSLGALKDLGFTWSLFFK